MTTLDLPAPDLLAVRLEPERRMTLGAGATVGAVIGRVALGRPICRPVDPDSVDNDAKPFLAGRPQSAFTLLGLTVSFAHEEQNPLESAWVDVLLGGQVPADAPQPVAWSMQPLSESDPVAVSTRASFDASLKFTGSPLPVDAGPSLSRERDRSYERRAVSVEALREGTDSPRWQFFATEVSPIRGTHRLLLIVETAAGSSGRAQVTIGATIRLRRLKVFRYRAALDVLPDMASIAIPPPG